MMIRSWWRQNLNNDYGDNDLKDYDRRGDDDDGEEDEEVDDDEDNDVYDEDNDVDDDPDDDDDDWRYIRSYSLELRAKLSRLKL